MSSSPERVGFASCGVWQHSLTSQAPSFASARSRAAWASVAMELARPTAPPDVAGSTRYGNVLFEVFVCA